MSAQAFSKSPRGILSDEQLQQRKWVGNIIRIWTFHFSKKFWKNASGFWVFSNSKLESCCVVDPRYHRDCLWVVVCFWSFLPCGNIVTSRKIVAGHSRPLDWSIFVKKAVNWAYLEVQEAISTRKTLLQGCNALVNLRAYSLSVSYTETNLWGRYPSHLTGSGDVQ